MHTDKKTPLFPSHPCISVKSVVNFSSEFRQWIAPKAIRLWMTITHFHTFEYGKCVNTR
jgi:hypothetical protein